MDRISVKLTPELMDFCDYLPGDIAYLKKWTPGIDHFDDPVKILDVYMIIINRNIVVYRVKNLNNGRKIILNQNSLKKKPKDPKKEVKF